MTIAQAFLPEFDHEMATTRSLLALVPDDRATWKAHPKSFSIGDTAAHLANLPVWAIMTMRQREFDANPPGGPAWTSPKFGSTAENLANFDRNIADARAAIGEANDADYMVTWSLKNNGATVLSMPRVACIRSFVINHIIHHRGQLSVYLRLLDIPLPSIYGPTADS